MDKLFSGVELLKGSLPSNGVVGLYFSAHWCPPCRGFTPKLAEAYKDIKEAADKPFEVVFISSDKDQKQFDEYFAEMPWLGLPYEQRELKGKLSKKFKVNGIPSLILLDAKTGKVITTDGRSAITKDPKGAKYPWTPPNPLEALGSTFVGEGKDTSIKGKYVGIYFSAHWCGPCRNFTPKLAETYKKLKAAGKEFEVVFCSADRDQTQFDEYFGTMPWIALPFEDRERAETLNELFGVEGIPSLVILAPDGTTVTTDGTDALRGDPDGADFPWLPKPVRDLESAGAGLNSAPALIAFAEGCPAPAQQAAAAALLAVAEERRAAAAAAAAAGGDEEDELVLCTATQAGGGIAGQVRKLCGLGEPGPEPRLVLLDIPDGGAFYAAEAGAPADAAGVRAFLAAYAAKTLPRQQLSRG